MLYLRKHKVHIIILYFSVIEHYVDHYNINNELLLALNSTVMFRAYI